MLKKKKVFLRENWMLEFNKGTWQCLTKQWSAFFNRWWATDSLWLGNNEQWFFSAVYNTRNLVDQSTYEYTRLSAERTWHTVDCEFQYCAKYLLPMRCPPWLSTSAKLYSRYNINQLSQSSNYDFGSLNITWSILHQT